MKEEGLRPAGLLQNIAEGFGNKVQLEEAGGRWRSIANAISQISPGETLLLAYPAARAARTVEQRQSVQRSHLNRIHLKYDEIPPAIVFFAASL